MRLVFAALLAELLEFQAILEDFLVFLGAVVQRLADRALHFDEIILGHTWKKWWKMLAKVYGKAGKVSNASQNQCLFGR